VDDEERSGEVFEAWAQNRVAQGFARFVIFLFARCEYTYIYKGEKNYLSRCSNFL
jgi:hypothetical protein